MNIYQMTENSLKPIEVLQSSQNIINIDENIEIYQQIEKILLEILISFLLKPKELKLKLRKIFLFTLKIIFFFQKFALTSFGLSYISISHEKLSFRPPFPHTHKNIIN